MKKVFVVFCLFLISISFVYSQKKIKKSCKQNLENIFDIQKYRYKYEIVQFIYKYRNGGMFFKNDHFLDYASELIKGCSYFEEKEEVWKGGLVTGPISDEQATVKKVEFMSKDEMNRYLEHLNYTPEEASRVYRNHIRNIKLEKEMYLKCIDKVIAKGSASKKNAEPFTLYDFTPPNLSLLPPSMSKLVFLQVVKEFIFNNDEEVLPDYERLFDFLKKPQI